MTCKVSCILSSKGSNMASLGKRHRTALLLELIWLIGLCGGAWGIEFAGGTGEPNDPYQIATVPQLTAIGSDPVLPGKHYVLAADIDLSGTVRSAPVIPLLRGSFDGRGHTIRNLRIETGGSQGLFGHIDSEAEVKNLGVVDAYVVGLSSPGALSAWNHGRVLNCYSTGTVSSGGHAGGGLVGSNWGTVANSYSTATVTGGILVGGLVGENAGSVISCHSSGEVTASSLVGGLVGDNFGAITSSYSTATVTGLMWSVGGLAGENRGRIASCYAEATVLGYDMFVGGLVGENGGSISCCYSDGTAVGEEMVGGLVGYNPGKVATSYSVAAVTDRSYSWHIGGLVGAASAPDNCYFLAPPDGTGPDNDIGTPLTSIQMEQQASFVGWDFWGTLEDGPSDPWFMPTDAYPVLSWQTEITGLQAVPSVAGLPLDEARAVLEAAGFVAGDLSYDFHRTIPGGYVIRADPDSLAPAGATVDLILSSAGSYNWVENPGDGTAARPYQISTPGQLESLIGHPELWDRHFVLSADVDMTGRRYSTALIAPDVDNSNSGFQGTPFRGTFDGQDHAIRNLTIQTDWRQDYVGLFGMVAPEARIDRLHLPDANVKGGSGSKSYVGVLAGQNAGTVAHSSATGVLRGGRGDGLVGLNTGSLIDCRVDIARI